MRGTVRVGWKGGVGVTEPLEPYGSSLEVLFALQLREAGIPFEREVKPIPGRRYRFDFYFEPDLLVEINGGTYQHMGHSSPLGIQRDYDKLNQAVLAGYRVLMFSGEDVQGSKALVTTMKALGWE